MDPPPTWAALEREFDERSYSFESVDVGGPPLDSFFLCALYWLGEFPRKDDPSDVRTLRRLLADQLSNQFPNGPENFFAVAAAVRKLQPERLLLSWEGYLISLRTGELYGGDLEIAALLRWRKGLAIRIFTYNNDPLFPINRQDHGSLSDAKELWYLARIGPSFRVLRNRRRTGVFPADALLYADHDELRAWLEAYFRRGRRDRSFTWRQFFSELGYTDVDAATGAYRFRKWFATGKEPKGMPWERLRALKQQKSLSQPLTELDVSMAEPARIVLPHLSLLSGFSMHECPRSEVVLGLASALFRVVPDAGLGEHISTARYAREKYLKAEPTSETEKLYDDRIKALWQFLFSANLKSYRILPVLFDQERANALVVRLRREIPDSVLGFSAELVGDALAAISAALLFSNPAQTDSRLKGYTDILQHLHKLPRRMREDVFGVVCRMLALDSDNGQEGVLPADSHYDALQALITEMCLLCSDPSPTGPKCRLV